MKTAKKITKIGIYLLLFITSFMFVFERFFWTNADSYPEILTTGHVSKLSTNEFLSMRKSCGQPLEIHTYPSYIAIRCGTFWPFAKVVLIDEKKMPWHNQN